MLAPVQNDNWRKGVIMREALSVIVRETLNVILNGCEESVPVVGKTVRCYSILKNRCLYRKRSFAFSRDR